MARISPVLKLTDDERLELEALSKKGKVEQRLAKRARIILLCAGGMPVKDIATKMDIRPNTVIDRRKAFEANRLGGLYDAPRTGRPREYGDDFRNLILSTLEQKPPQGFARWDGAILAKHLNVSADAVWRILRKEGIQLSRKRSWCVSTDPEFAAKSADVIGLYLNPPDNAVVFSVDEKPGMQALECPGGYVQTSNGKIVQGYKSTYKRHGTLNLFAALNVASGEIVGKITEYKKRPDFIEFMEGVVADIDLDKEIHVILDNYCIHKKNAEWLEKHPNVYFHFTPTSASWLNQVEIWFGIFTRKTLRNASFASKSELKDSVEAYLKQYNKNPRPFVWRKREVKGSQLKNTIVNLCN